MIKSYKCAETKALYLTGESSKFSSILHAALKRLDTLNAAKVLSDLRSPPGNRLEKLVGDKKGRYSIRINDQWRLCFYWRDSDSWEVEIVDYH